MHYIGIAVLLEKIDKFCYLGDVLDIDKGCDSAVVAKSQVCMEKNLTVFVCFHWKGFLLKLKGKSCLIVRLDQ